jgi:hypothetical protein
MAKFLTGKELNNELGRIIKDADEELILISPYIKLHKQYSSILLSRLKEVNLHIIILFGKNEEDLSKSMKKDDFEFFKQFPNITIMHENRLHAKYYSNEKESLLSSMNLYDFSQDNNIEAGVLMKSTRFGGIIGDNVIDNEAFDYFTTVLDNANVLFDKEPIFSSRLLGLNKKYSHSEINIDDLSIFFDNKSNYKPKKRYEIRTKIKYHKQNVSKGKSGYCIRTGVKIPFNVEKPFSTEALKIWSRYNDKNYPEKYCHFSGEKSEGKTSFSRPILNKNWKKAKAEHKL